jgi:hypothetical protein
MSRIVIGVLLATVPLLAMDLKVDHVTVAGRDLAALTKAFADIGIRAEYGGKHTNGMTEMAIASFPDGSYLELIAAQPGASAARHDWGPFIERDGGVCAWAVSVTDIRSEAERLRKAGTAIHPTPGGRTRPDGKSLAWTSGGVGPGPHGSFFPFLIQDDTSRELRVYPHGGPSVTALEGVALVVVAVRDLEAAVAKWRSTFALGEPRLQSDAALGARLAWFPGTPAVLAAPESPGSWIRQRLEQFGEAPFAILFRGRELPPHERTTWFGQRIGWFDPAALMGARVGVIATPGGAR